MTYFVQNLVFFIYKPFEIRTNVEYRNKKY